ncbi:hypothetical protein OIU77_014365 [Salix suchowensis]|uniref:Protein XRI1 n=1 Tax=Salix suchowensis TaxID=1278906 RepID=A0ABQ8ZX09_9ROSI|nr:hypothetical protein OIU77_014365 [Salix suchowensis]
MAYYNSSGGGSLSSLGWDLQNLGVLNADMSLAMDRTTSPFFSSLESDFSTGYLEDALLEFNERSKRRRLLLFSTEYDHGHHDQYEKSNDLPESNWDEENFDDWELMSENFSCLSHIAGVRGTSDEPMMSTIPHSADDEEEKRKKKVGTRVVYPFALVKPGGIEGGMTINDINERILMPPTRPVRHPVGDFACKPCVSADGPGLSGKAVVALTRIHTQGRGTITIIRTRG